MIHKVDTDLGGRKLSFETGKIAQQAHGAAWIRYEDTICLVTACRSQEATDRDFLPLTVEYRENHLLRDVSQGTFFDVKGEWGKRKP